MNGENGVNDETGVNGVSNVKCVSCEKRGMEVWGFIEV